jgi:hypothetical protein
MKASVFKLAGWSNKKMLNCGSAMDPDAEKVCQGN